jgi:hypothetical protein
VRTSLVGRTGFEPVTFSVSGKITGILALPSMSFSAQLAAVMWLGESGRG